MISSGKITLLIPYDIMIIDEIDKIASSTISTNAALRAINAAIEVYSEQIQGQGVDATAEATTSAEGEVA